MPRLPEHGPPRAARVADSPGPEAAGGGSRKVDGRRRLIVVELPQSTYTGHTKITHRMAAVAMSTIAAMRP
jgi:hypothetical protein